MVCITSDNRIFVSNELGGVYKEAAAFCVEVLYQRLYGVAEKLHEETGYPSHRQKGSLSALEYELGVVMLSFQLYFLHVSMNRLILLSIIIGTISALCFGRPGLYSIFRPELGFPG
jgi:hypothetical protein